MSHQISPSEKFTLGRRVEAEPRAPAGRDRVYRYRVASAATSHRHQRGGLYFARERAALCVVFLALLGDSELDALAPTPAARLNHATLSHIRQRRRLKKLPFLLTSEQSRRRRRAKRETPAASPVGTQAVNKHRGAPEKHEQQRGVVNTIYRRIGR